VRNRLAFSGLTAALVAAFAVGSGTPRAAAQSKPAYSSVTLSAGTSPSAAQIGDLDGDGLNDIAVINLEGNLQLFFNHGAGSFQRVSFNGLWPPPFRPWTSISAI
jgi:FG-GAP-like repeat